VKTSNTAFRALADGTRRRILTLLRAGPRTSGEIAAKFDSSWPTISRHLAVLREAGLVSTERRGQEIYYELNTSVFQDLAQYLMEWSATGSSEVAAPSRRPTARRIDKPQEA
jgi:ArsR family transcriptional regulator, arsenate/arsenite/antimonite-responsive transcriptional repressor